MKGWRAPQTMLAAIFVVLLASRLAHLRIVWVEEGYPAAAAIQILDSGKVLYRDIWFDKPAGTAYLYCLWGARTGLALRLADTVFLFACCVLLYCFGRSLWGRELEGLVAASFLAIYLTFGIPAAVMAIAPDLALVLPHIAAIYLAFLKRPGWAGAMAGIGFWINTKALFVLASCVLFLTPGLDWLRLACGFAAVTGLQFGVLLEQGALGAYWDQVWRWGAVYTGDTFVDRPWLFGLRQTLKWCGFQSAAVAGMVVWCWNAWNSEGGLKPATTGGSFPLKYWRLTAPYGRGSEGSLIFIGWIALSLIPVALGLRFFPRYYFQVLPIICLLGARGFAVSTRTVRYLMLALTLIPVVRFGPRYVTLTADLIAHRTHIWTDLALAQDSERVAAILGTQPRGTLFVWGYRPDIYALTRLPAARKFLDSQPISGVLADRHLTSAKVSAPEWAARFRDNDIGQADYVVDGLGRLNPHLAIPPAWLAPYELLAETGQSLVYRRTAKR